MLFRKDYGIRANDTSSDYNLPYMTLDLLVVRILTSLYVLIADRLYGRAWPSTPGDLTSLTWISPHQELLITMTFCPRKASRQRHRRHKDRSQHGKLRSRGALGEDCTTSQFCPPFIKAPRMAAYR